MSADTIFAASTTIEAVWSEIDRLREAVKNGFVDDVTLDFGEPAADEAAPNTRYGYHYQLTLRGSRRRTPAQLLLTFDLARPDMRSDWSAGQSALMTVAYAPVYEEGWRLDHVLLGADGKLTASDAVAKCVPYFDNRLLWWQDRAETWERSSWLFSVPLLALDGMEAVRYEIVTPVLTLLRATDDSIDPFAGTAAVTFTMPAGADV